MKLITEIRVTVPFRSFKKKTLDQKAVTQIKRYIRRCLADKAGYVPLYVEKGIDGRPMEDVSKKISVRIKKATLRKK